MRTLLVLSAFLSFVFSPVNWATSFIAFESGPVRPLAMSPDGSQLFATNIPDNRLEVFNISSGLLVHTDSIPVGMEPVSVATRNNDEIWVVNQLSDSVSIIDLTTNPPRVVRTLLVGDEPRDIVFAGTGVNNRAFITTARRGQHRVDASISAVPGAGDPQLSVAGVGRADVWVFDAMNLGGTIGGTPIEILTFFADTPRALAVSPDNTTVYVAAFHSGNQTTAIGESSVPDGFDLAGPDGSGAPGGVPGPSDNAAGDPAPDTGVIVKFDGTNWRDSAGKDWSALVPFDLPDHDVFSINANTLASGSIQEFDQVGTILFNMVVNPVSGKVYVTNTELPNDVRFEGSGDHGGSTVQGHVSESRITVIDPVGLSVDPQHLNQHIDYGKLHTDTPDLVDSTQINHSLATPLQPVVSSDGSTLYVPAFGSEKIGVFATSDIEDPNFETNFDPTTESANYLSTGGGPSGLALNEIDNRLYVLTRFANQVEVIDLSSGNTLQTHALHNPEPQSVVEGRPFLYSALTTSGNGEASCSSCHAFADTDSLAWNLGDPDASTSTNNLPPALFSTMAPFHPMKGPMTTQTLRGMATHGALHWRGDRLDGFFGADSCTEVAGAPCEEDHAFRNFIVAFEGLVGKDGTLSEPDMQKFSNFILQLLPPPNPVRNLDNSLTTPQQLGSTIYHDPFNTTDGVSNCIGCHSLDPAQGFFGSGGGGSIEGSTQDMKVPHIRNAYAKIGAHAAPGDQIKGFGFFHDGSVPSLKNFFEIPLFSLAPFEEDALVEFSLAFPTDLAPIVGQQVTLTASNGGVVGPRIDLMINRAAAFFDSLMLGGTVTECDLIVKGSVGGVERGWVREASGLFRDDINVTINDVALRALATTEGPLTYTCAPPGSGTRMGIDRDEDTVFDGIDVCPAVDDPAQLNFDGDSAGDACDSDDDNDGLLDIVETNTGTFVSVVDTGSDPFSDDTDGDGFLDGAEVIQGSDPNNAASTPTSTAAPLLSHWSLVLLFGVMIVIGIWMTARSRSMHIRG